jgi:enamidase
LQFLTILAVAFGVTAYAHALHQVVTPELALVGGTVIDGTGAPPRPQCTVLIRGDRIVAVGPNLRLPDRAIKIDVAGKTILPGLVDMHGHLYANTGGEVRNEFSAYARLYLAGGVTTVFSPGDFDPAGTIDFRDRVNLGQEVGPRILTAGPYFDHSPSKVGFIKGVHSPAEATQLFDVWKGRIDAVKVYRSITEPELVAVIDAAHRAGKRVVGHLESVTATRAIELGIDGLEHGLFAMSELAHLDSKGFPGTEFMTELANLDLDGPGMRNLIAAIAERRVVIDPTTVTFQSLLPEFEPVTLDWKKYVAPTVGPNVDRDFAWFQRLIEDEGPRWPVAARAALRKQGQFVKAIHDRGGIVVAGTDPVGLNLTPGYGIHREIANLVAAGLSPVEAIKAATYNAALALHREKDLGTIETGKIADLVVVSGNPAHSIEDIGRTELVIAGGIRFDPAELRRSAEGAIR